MPNMVYGMQEKGKEWAKIKTRHEQ